MYGGIFSFLLNGIGGNIISLNRSCLIFICTLPQLLHDQSNSFIVNSLGQVENAKKHIFFPGNQPHPIEMQMLQSVEKHLSKCADSRKVGDWISTLREADAVIASGVDASPQVLFLSF